MCKSTSYMLKGGLTFFEVNMCIHFGSMVHTKGLLSHNEVSGGLSEDSVTSFTLEQIKDLNH